MVLAFSVTVLAIGQATALSLTDDVRGEEEHGRAKPLQRRVKRRLSACGTACRFFAERADEPAAIGIPVQPEKKLGKGMYVLYCPKVIHRMKELSQTIRELYGLVMRPTD
jgi:hypothetical protein